MDANPTSTMPAFRGSWHWEAVFQSQDDPSEVGMHLLLDGEYATPHQAETALEEMLTNIVKYGYDTPGHHEARVNLSVTDQALVLTLEDWGHEFDPLKHEVKAIPEEIAERQIGGMGIHLTRSMTDRMEYRRVNDCNLLTIQVNIAAE